MHRIKWQTTYLKPSERITGIQKEHHVRSKDGKVVCFLLLDRYKKVIILTQKLTAACDFINKNIVQHEEKWAKVNLNGLFENLDRTDGRAGGYHKGRWRVISVKIEEACAKFDEARKEYEIAAVVGILDYYEISENGIVTKSFPDPDSLDASVPNPSLPNLSLSNPSLPGLTGCPSTHRSA